MNIERELDMNTDTILQLLTPANIDYTIFVNTEIDFVYMSSSHKLIVTQNSKYTYEKLH